MTLGPVLLVLMLGATTAFFRLWRGTWLAPSAFLGLIWAPYLALGLLTIERHVSTYGFAILLLLVTAIQTGAFLMEGFGPVTRSGLTIHDSLVRRPALVFTVLAFSAIIYLVWVSAALFDLDFSLMSVLHMGGFWTLQRYSGVPEPLPYRIMIIWLHPAALLGGMAFPLKGRRNQVVALLSLLPALLCSILTGARAVFLVGFACWLGGYLASMQLQGRRQLFRWKVLVSVALTVVILLLLFVATDAVRITSNPEEFVLQSDNAHIQDYMFGSAAAFDYWADHMNAGPYRFGALTFSGLYGMLGISPRVLGMYQEEISVIPGYYTNVFTVFRGFIEDFSLPGAVVLCLMIGIISGYAFSVAGRRSLVLLSGFYAFALFTPLYSLFDLNGTIFAWIVVCVILSLFRSSPVFRLGRAVSAATPVVAE